MANTSTLDIRPTWQRVEKRCHVKEKRQSDNCTESEHCSWESGFPQRRRRAVWRGYLFFICRWKLKNVGEGPSGITDERWGSWGYCLAPLPPPPPSPIHFPSPTFLIFARALPQSLWEKAERKKRSEAAHSPCHLCLPHSQTWFIPHSCGLQSSAVLCSAAAASSAAEQRSSLGSSQICLPVCGKRGALSQPCSLTAFPSHSRVIKKEPHTALNPQALPPSPPVFSRHCSTSVSSGTSGMNILADTFTPAGPDWITGKEEEFRYISWARLSLHGLVEARLRYHGSSWKTASLLPVPLNE